VMLLSFASMADVIIKSLRESAIRPLDAEHVKSSFELLIPSTYFAPCMDYNRILVVSLQTPVNVSDFAMHDLHLATTMSQIVFSVEPSVRAPLWPSNSLPWLHSKVDCRNNNNC
jgi:hypothetical protein